MFNLTFFLNRVNILAPSLLPVYEISDATKYNVKTANILQKTVTVQSLNYLIFRYKFSRMPLRKSLGQSDTTIRVKFY